MTRIEYGRRHDRDACGCDMDDDTVYEWGPTFAEPSPVHASMSGHLYVRVQRTVTVGEWETAA